MPIMVGSILFQALGCATGVTPPGLSYCKEYAQARKSVRPVEGTGSNFRHNGQLIVPANVALHARIDNRVLNPSN